MKAASGTTTNPPAPTSDTTTAEVDVPKKFVPPGLRGRTDGTSGARDQSPSDVNAKWRSSSQRGGVTRGESPADAAAPKNPPRSRMADVAPPRDDSSADGAAPRLQNSAPRADVPPRNDSPSAPSSSTGKYVPRFKRG